MNPQHPQQTAILDYPDIIKHQSDEGVPRNEMDPFNERGPLREVGRFDDRGPHREIRHFDERGQHQEVDPFDDRGHHSVQLVENLSNFSNVTITFRIIVVFIIC